MTYEVELAGVQATIEVRPHPEGGHWVAIDGGEARHVQATHLGVAEWTLGVGGRSQEVAVRVVGERVDAQLADGTGVSGTVVDPRDKALATLSGGGEGGIVTPMPGSIVRVLVAAGDEVAQGDVLVVVEAMKMENEFKAPFAGRVQEVHVEAGVSVDSGTLLVTLDDPEGAA